MADVTAVQASDEPERMEVAVRLDELGEASSLVREVVRSGRPTILTEGGVGIAAILDAETYEAVRGDILARTLAADLQRAAAQADAGDVLTHEEVMDRIRRRFRGRVSPALQRRLDRL